MTYDPKCGELADYFLRQAPDEKLSVLLAQHIQDTVETWLQSDNASVERNYVGVLRQVASPGERKIFVLEITHFALEIRLRDEHRMNPSPHYDPDFPTLVELIDKLVSVTGTVNANILYIENASKVVGTAEAL